MDTLAAPALDTDDAPRAAHLINLSGSWTDVAAPGDGIPSAPPGGAWGSGSGTSMAAPLAAGPAVPARSLDLAVTPKDLARRLRETPAPRRVSRLRGIDAAAALSNRVTALPVFR